jgi:hypothetical protein
MEVGTDHKIMAAISPSWTALLCLAAVSKATIMRVQTSVIQSLHEIGFIASAASVSEQIDWRLIYVETVEVGSDRSQFCRGASEAASRDTGCFVIHSGIQIMRCLQAD